MELLSVRKAAKALGLKQAELRYNAEMGLVPCLKLKSRDGSDLFRFDLDMIKEAMKDQSYTNRSLLKNYKVGRYGILSDISELTYKDGRYSRSRV